MVNRSPREAELLGKATSYIPGGTVGNTSFPDDLQFLAKEGKGAHIWDCLLYTSDAADDLL